MRLHGRKFVGPMSATMRFRIALCIAVIGLLTMAAVAQPSVLTGYAPQQDGSSTSWITSSQGSGGNDLLKKGKGFLDKVTKP